MSKKKQRPILEILEPRLLYSADPFGAVFDLPAIDTIDGNTPSLLDSFERQPTPQSNSPLLTDELNTVSFELDTSLADQRNDARLELVFIDTGTPDYQQLLDDLLGQSDETRAFEVMVIDARANGVDTISEALINYRDIDAVHIISHGTNGALQLGSTTLNAQYLESQSNKISRWANTFSESGDILIYGCDLASDEAGKELIQSVAALTGTDVAASDDLTGHASLGGDWQLEHRVGAVESKIVFSSDLQTDWQNSLDISSNLIAHYKFDADASDNSGNTLDGALSNGAAIDTAVGTNQIGTGKLSLDGSDDYVDMNAHIAAFSGLADGTIAAWVRTTDTGESVVFALSDSDDPLSLTKFSVDTGQLKWLSFNDSGNDVIAYSTATINDGNWHHVAVTVYASGNTLYIDGAQVPVTYTEGDASRNVFFDDINDIDEVNQGRSVLGGSAESNFDGLIDDARVYSRALSSSDINELYNYTGNSMPVAVADLVNTNEDSPVVIDPTANDTDADGDAISIVEYTQPANASLTDNGDGTLTYTPDANFSGSDSFDYVAIDSGSGLQHHWGLGGDAVDAIGGTNGTITGAPATVVGDVGDALSFDESNDYITLPDLSYNNEFTLSFDFKVDELNGSLFQYLYSHGDINGFNRVNVFINEDSHGTDPNVLRTVVRDGNDTLDNSALEFNIASLVGDGQFHTYTLTVGTAGLEVFIDGVSVASDVTRGTDGVNPSGNAYLGIRQDLDSARMFGGVLDSVQVYDNALSSDQIPALASATHRASVDITVDAVNDTPISTTAVKINNHSFEANILSSDGSSTTTIAGWNITGTNTGTWNVHPGLYPSEAPDGINAGYIDEGGSISQTTSAVFSSGTDYELTVAVGDQSGGGDPSGWEIRIYAGAQLLGSSSVADTNPADGTFADVTLSLNATQLSGFSAFYGSNIRVELFDDGSSDNLQFDRVRLVQTSATVTTPLINYVENGSAVALLEKVSLFDSELSAADNYNGATFTLSRNGGTNTEDIFTPSGTITALNEGFNLQVDGAVIGSIVTNSGGTLSVLFNSNATQSLVNSFIQQIAYSNSSDSPPANVQVDWGFNDGNTGSQGTGGAQEATGTTTININSVNDAPSGADKTITIAEDTSHTFTPADFAFTDTDGHDFDRIWIMTLPSNGQLLYNGSTFAAGNWISSADISSGLLTFEPVADNNGTSYTTFDFQVQDDGGTANGGQNRDTTSNTITFDVNAVNDPPTITSTAGTAATEDTLYTYTAMVTDPDDANNGTDLTWSLSGAPAGMVVSSTGVVTWTPAEGVTTSGAVTLTVSDGNEDSAVDATEVFTIAVTAVNDVPVATGNTVVASEDVPFVIGADDFNFTDVETDALASVTITGLTLNGGTLTHSAGAVTVTNGMTVTAAELADLTFTSASNDSTNSSFTYTVNDADNGVTSAVMNISVNSVNDDPINVGSFPTDITVVEDLSSAVDLSMINLSDVDHAGGSMTLTLSTSTGGDLSATSGGGITVGGSGSGVLTLSGTLTDLNTYLDTASNVQYLHGTSNTFGDNADTINVVINDGGNTGSGGGTDQDLGTTNIDITAADDTPVLGNNSLTLFEGGTVVINSTYISGTDLDSSDPGLLFTISNVSGGHFAWSASPQALISSFTQAQVSASQVVFVHDGGEAAPNYEVAIGDGSTSTVATAAVISFTNINDAPTLTALGGDSQTVANDGTVASVDTGAIATLIDADQPANYDGATLVVTGNSFDGLDLLGVSTAGSISLSSGISDGSLLSVGGTNVATLSATSSSGITFTFNANATAANVDAILRSVTFESNSPTLGSRSIDFNFNDGDGTSNGGNDTSSTATVNVALASADDGLVIAVEDTTYIFNATDFDFTGVTGGNLDKITITTLPSDGTLTLNGSLMTVNQEITKAEVDAALFRFAPATNANGSLYASFDFFVNSGKDSVTVLAGEPSSSFTLGGGSLAPTDAIIADVDNFGPGGTVSTTLSVTSTSTTIDAAYLSQGSVFFNGYVPNANWTAGELTSLDNWVQAGGILISNSDAAGYDQVSTFYGLTVGGTANPIWHVDDTTHAIMNGPFGLVGTSADPFSAAGSISYFNSASLAPGDQVIAIDSVSGEPTMVLRQVGSGHILFTGDEGIFRANMTGGGDISTANDILAANVFAWAADQVTGVTTHLMNIDVDAVNDNPTNNGSLPGSINVTEDVSSSVNLSALDLNDVDHTGGNLTLTLSTSTGGNLSASTASGVTVGGSATGIMTLTGTQADLNTYLNTSSNIQYLHGTPNTVGSVADTIGVAINDNGNTGSGGGSDQALGSVSVNITAVNDLPVASGNTIIASEDVPLVIGPAEFNFSDVEGDALASVTITGLNLNGGTLTHSAGAVTVIDGMTITAAQLADLTFTAALNDATDSSFTYTVNDTGTGVTSAVMNITVNAVNDAPSITSTAGTTATEESLYTYTATVADPDDTNNGTDLIWNLSGAPAGMVVSSTGVVTWTPAEGATTSGAVTLTVSDGNEDGAVDATEVFTIAVTSVNDAPTITSTAGTTATEDTLYTYTAAVTDPDDANNGTDLTWSLSGAPAGMLVSSTGVVTWTPTEGVTTSGAVTLTVSDGNEDGAVDATEVFTIAVTPINDAPTITSTASTAAAEDTLYTYTATVADPDDTNNGTDLIWSLSGAPAGMVVSSTGVVTWTPAEGVTTSGAVTLTVSDGNEDGAVDATEVFTIAVTPVNDAPTITSTAGITATEDTLYTYTATVTDPDDANNGTDLTWSLSGAPAGMVVSSTGVVTWTPPEGVTTSGAVTLIVSDGNEDGAVDATEVFTISVTPVNDAPTITSTAGTTATEDTLYTYAATVTDPDDANNGTDLTWSLSGAPAGMVVSSTGVVTSVNDVPVATGNTVVASEDVPLVIAANEFNFTDVEGDALVSVTISGLTLNGGTLTHSAGAVIVADGMTITAAELADLTFTSALNDSTNSSFTYTVNDAGNGVASALMNITVNAINDVPVATGNTIIASEDVPLLIAPSDFSFNDAEGDSLTSVTITGLTLNGGTLTHSAGAVNVTNGMSITAAELADLTFTSALNNDTDSSFTYTVDDADTGVTSALMNITVNAVNDLPVATGNTVTTDEDAPLVISPSNFNFSDIEGDALSSVTLTGLNLNGGTLTHSAGAVTVTDGMMVTAAELADLTFTSALNDSSNASFSYTVNDADTGVAAATMNITVNALNDTPVAAGNTVSTNEDVPLVIAPSDFAFTDVEGDGLVSVTLTGLNLNGGTLTHSAGAVNVTNGMTITAAELADLTFTSALNDATNSSFSYSVNDADNGVASAVMNITVNAVNDVPVATGNTVTANEDVPLVIGPSDFSFSDVENDALSSLTITGLNLNGGSLTHSAGAVTVTDGMSITAAALADLTFTSALNDSTNSSFTYTVNDAENGITSAVMNITVNAVNDAPVATDNSVVALEDTALVFDPSDFTFSDIESNALTSVTVTGLNLNGGTLTHSAGAVTVSNGMSITAADLADLTFMSALNDSTNSSFTYTVNDADAGVSSATMNITVNAVNDVPVATGNTVTADEDVPLVIGPSDFAFTDVESDNLASVTLTGLTLNGGTLTHSAGAVTVSNGMSITAAELADLAFTSALNDSTNSSFTYTVNDGDNGITSAAMNITVNAVNDAPVASGHNVTAIEDIPRVIDAENFLYTDIESDTLSSITVSNLQLNGGSLSHSSGAVTVSDGMTITAAELLDLTFVPALHSNLPASFDYRVNDDDNGANSASLSITILPRNDAPVIITSNGGADTATESTVENNEHVTTIAAIDADIGDTIAYGIDGGADASLFNIDRDSGELRFAHAPNFENAQDANRDNDYEVVVTASDGNGGLDQQTLNIAVLNENERPAELSLSNDLIDEDTDTTGGFIIGQLSATDEDLGDTLNYSLVGGADVALFSLIGNESDTLMIDAGVIDYKQQPAYELVVRTTDNSGAWVDRVFNITVTPRDTIILPITETTKAPSVVTPVVDPFDTEPTPLSEEAEALETDTPSEPPANPKSSVDIRLESISVDGMVTLASELNTQHEQKAVFSTDQKSVPPLKHLDLTNLSLMPLDALNIPEIGALTMLENEPFTEALERMSREMERAFEEDQKQHQLIAEISSGVTLSLTAGFISWMLQSGSLLASLLSAAPVWKKIDPLLILAASKRKPEEITEETEEEKRVAEMFD